jgi:hypothetical protein
MQTRSGKGRYDDVPESSTSRHGAFRRPMPPPSPPMPPVSLEQLLTSLNAIMLRFVEIGECQAGRSQQQQQSQESSYFDFLATQPLEFTVMTDPLEANHWLCVTKSKFGLLHCSEFQKTLFVAQQLHGSASAWWATYTAAIQDNHQVSWNKFCTTFHERHISTRIMCHKLRGFLDLQQGIDSVYEYIKNFDYLAQ